jgi:glutamyl-Q tRNA(Asp) synthetase
MPEDLAAEAIVTTRFAPSPTGYLHLGHALAAVTAWRRARDAGGRFLLRLEDIDAARCRPEYADAIAEDLAWLGLDWDGEVRVQSRHAAEYQAALDHLDARGLLYPCFCTRAEIAREVAAAAAAPHGLDGPLYPGTCRRLSPGDRASRLAAGMPYALRLDMAQAQSAVPGPLFFHDETAGTVQARPELLGDVVLGRKEFPGSYHLCVTHDDARQGVTLVTRGADLLPATHLHRLLQGLFGWTPPLYAHHPLLSGPGGRRLAKRDGALTLRALRAEGVSPGSLLARISFQSG